MRPMATNEGYGFTTPQSQPTAVTPSTGAPSLGYGAGPNDQWQAILHRLQTDPLYLQQELQRAAQVAAFRAQAGLDTTAQRDYYQMLLGMQPQQMGSGQRPMMELGGSTAPMDNPMPTPEGTARFSSGAQLPVPLANPGPQTQPSAFAGQKIGPAPQYPEFAGQKIGPAPDPNRKKGTAVPPKATQY